MVDSLAFYTHIFGIDMGIFISAFLLTLMFALSFFFQNGFHRFYLRLFGLASLSLISITLYNMFFQYTMYHETPEFYGTWILNYGKYFGPVGLALLTYFFLVLSMTNSVKSLSFYYQRQGLIQSLYAVDVAFLVMLFFIENTINAVILIELLFMLHVAFGLFYFCQAYPKGMLRRILIGTMCLTMLALFVLSYNIYSAQPLPKMTFLLFNSMLAVAALTLSFIAVRSGFDEASRFFTESEGKGQRHLVGDVFTAIKHDEFFLEYQPKRNLHTGDICGFEALIRWQHPKYGRLMPNEFVLMTEKTELINLVCQWVIDSVVQQAKAFEKEHYNLPISLNFSVNNIMPDMANYLIERLKKYDLPSDKVVVEITESIFLQNDSEKKAAIRLLNDADIVVSIDDYGAGFSSLNYLNKLNVGELKIDRSFIFDLVNSPQNQVIVRSILQMSQELGIRVVAEGVEDEATSQLLQDYGCDVIQGYHLAKPLPDHQLNTWLSEHHVAKA